MEQFNIREGELASERRMRWIYDHIPLGVLVVDRDGQLIQCNAALSRLIGYTQSELAAMRPGDLIHPEDRERHLEATSQLRKADAASLEFEERYLRKDGQSIWVRTSMSLLRDDSAGSLHSIYFLTDIHWQKAAEATRDDLFAETNDLIQSVAPDGSILYANQSWCTTLGYSKAELASLNIFQIIHPECQPHCMAALGRLLQGENVGLIEVTYVARDGHTVELEGNVSARVVDGKMVSTRGIFRDVTARKEAEKSKQAEALKAALLLQTACDSIHILDSEGNALQVSESFARELQYSMEEAQRLNVRDWDAQIQPEEFRNVLERLLACPDGQTFETLHRRKDGSVFNVEVNARSVTVDGRRLLYCASRNISARRAAEQALRESEQRFRDLFDYAPDAYFIMDSEQSHRIIACNKAAVNMLRGSEEQILGKTPIDFSPPRQPDGRPSEEALAKAIQEIRLDGGPTNFEFLHRRRDGEQFWVSVSVSIINHGGRQELVVWRDFTARKAAEARIQLMLQKLERSNAELEQFAYVASHDLQEPLRAVSGCAQLIEREYRGKLDPSADELIVHIVEGVSRMQNLINDLLAYSRVSTTGSDFAETDLEAVLAVALQNLSASIAESEAQITHDLLPTVQCDRTQLIQLFQNLLGNALKFRADRRPEIHISAERQPTAWQFRISDNGIGVQSEYRERIFEVFQRLHTREKFAGTGIGLAICKKIVERHEGKIWVESSPGQGATFLFTLPTDHQGTH